MDGHRLSVVHGLEACRDRNGDRPRPLSYRWSTVDARASERPGRVEGHRHKIEQQQRTNSARLYKVTFTKAPAPTEPPDPPGHPEDAKTASLASPASPANDSNGLGV